MKPRSIILACLLALTACSGQTVQRDSVADSIDSIEARKDLLWVLEQDPDDYTRDYVDQYLQMLDQQQKSEV